MKNPEFALTIHPARKNLPLTLLLGALMLGIAWFFARLFQNYLWGILAVLLFLFSLRAYFLPRTYFFREAGLSVKTPGRETFFPWEKFRSFQIYPRGVYLSPLSDPRRFDRFRGIYLPLPEEQIKPVKEFLEAALGSARPANGNEKTGPNDRGTKDEHPGDLPAGSG